MEEFAVPGREPGRARGLAITAGLSTLTGSMLTLAAIFPSYDSGGLAVHDVTGLFCRFIVLVLGLALAGVLLVLPRHRIVGATSLIVLAVTLSGYYVTDLSQYWQTQGPEARAGIWLAQVGYLLFVVGAVFAALALLGSLWSTPDWSIRGRVPLAGAAAFTGFATAVGYALEPWQDSTGTSGSDLFSSSRVLWATILVVIALSVLPYAAVAARRRAVAGGITLGLFIMIVATAAYRLLFVYGSISGKPSTLTAIEGTWMFLAAGLAMLLILGYRLLALPDDEVHPAPAGQTETRAIAAIRPAAPTIVAAILGLAGAVVTFASLFPQYFRGTAKLGEYGTGATYASVFTHGVTFIEGIAIASIGLLVARRSVTSAAALAVIVVLFLNERVADVTGRLGFGFGLNEVAPGVGFWLAEIGFALVLVGTVVAIARTRSQLPPVSGKAPSGRVVAAAAFLGFATSVGLAMSYYRARQGALGGVTDYFLSRGLWAALLAIVAVPVISTAAALTRRRAVAAGLTLGLLVFVVAVALFRLGFTYDPGFGSQQAIEGTWMLLASGAGLLLVLSYRLWDTRVVPVVDTA